MILRCNFNETVLYATMKKNISIQGSSFDTGNKPYHMQMNKQ